MVGLDNKFKYDFFLFDQIPQYRYYHHTVEVTFGTFKKY